MNINDDYDDKFIAVLNRMCLNPSNKNQNQFQKYRQPQHQQQGLNDEEKRLNKQRKYEREQRKLKELMALPEFQPLKSYAYYFINRMTPLMIILNLLEQAEETVKYTIDTEGDWLPTKPAIIQVEFIDNNDQESIVLLFEMVHLPEPRTHHFRFIQKLFATILKPSNEILTWSDVKKELLDFVPYNLFSIDQVNSMNASDMQGDFKDWYNERFPHHEDCDGFSPFGHMQDDHPYCTCKHRPYKSTNDKWGLQMAIATTFGEFLDKKFRKSRWSAGLDRRLDPSYKPGQQQQNYWKQRSNQNRVKYAVHDCLSVTKLAMVIQNEWSREELDQYNQHQHHQH